MLLNNPNPSEVVEFPPSTILCKLSIPTSTKLTNFLVSCILNVVVTSKQFCILIVCKLLNILSISLVIPVKLPFSSYVAFMFTRLSKLTNVKSSNALPFGIAKVVKFD